MKRERTVSMMLTEDEHKLFMKAMMKAEIISGKRISVSQFMRDTFLPILNGDHDTPTDKSVSTEPVDTDSKQKKNWEVFNVDDMYEDT